MTRPTKVRISHIWHTISYIPHDEWTTEHTRIGISQPAQGIIKVRLGDEDGEYTSSVIKDTLLHEILHSIWAHSGLHSNVPKVDPYEREELIVASMSTMLLQVFIDNPALIRHFLEKS